MVCETCSHISCFPTVTKKPTKLLPCHPAPADRGWLKHVFIKKDFKWRVFGEVKWTRHYSEVISFGIYIGRMLGVIFSHTRMLFSAMWIKSKLCVYVCAYVYCIIVITAFSKRSNYWVTALFIFGTVLGNLPVLLWDRVVFFLYVYLKSATSCGQWYLGGGCTKSIAKCFYRK